MFKIRGIDDYGILANRKAISQVQEILKTQFPSLSEEDINAFPKHLTDHSNSFFHPTLFVACDIEDNVVGFTLLLHAPDLNFCFLEYLSVAKDKTGNGVGSTLYETVRKKALSLNTLGLFFECLPDDPKLCKDPETLKRNTARLRFYEKYGARPIINTKYETLLDAEDDSPPYLLFDDLGCSTQLRRDTVRSVVRAILERKYADLCTPEYIEMVVSSINDDPVKLREPIYVKKESVSPMKVSITHDWTLSVIKDRKMFCSS